MGYEFENIESQIGEVHALVKFKDEDEKRILDSIRLECERVKSVFAQVAVSGEQEKRVRRYFHFHQKSLSRLIDKVTEPARLEAADVLAAIRTLLVGLLDTLKSQFPDFFDINAPIPRFLRDRALRELTAWADLLTGKFVKTALDPKLFDIVSYAFRDREAVSYQRIDYLRELHERLTQLDVYIDDPDLLRQDLCKVLINCNYNAPRFFEYYTGGVKKALISCETLSDRIDLVSWYLKNCYQDQSLQEISFHPHLPPIHVQLGEWLSHELDYNKQKQQLFLSPGLLGEGPEKDFKMSFDLSVSQLAYLFKALIETGVLRNKNTSQLIRFLVKFVKTKKSESVSYESFRMKFYNPESGTKDAVKKVLGSLLQYMSKN